MVLFLLHISYISFGNLMVKRKESMLDCKSLVRGNMTEWFVYIHRMTGCDANSYFLVKTGESSMVK